jgi:hypothetical protein
LQVHAAPVRLFKRSDDPPAVSVLRQHELEFFKLVAAVRALVGNDAAQVLGWQRTAVTWRVVSEVTGSLHRLSGTWTDGTSGAEVKPWLLIIKANRRPPALPVAAEAEWRIMI